MLGKGAHPDDVLEFVVEGTLKRMAHKGWVAEGEKGEILAVRRRILCAYNNTLLEGYTPDIGIPIWLPGEFHKDWSETITAGGTPQMHFAGRFCVKSRWGSKAKNGTHKTGTEAPRSPGIEAKPFTRFDPAMLPARAWLYGKHYQRGIITSTVGPGGGGKSSLDLVELIAICTARPLLEEQPTVRCRAWYHNAEDDRDEIYRRIAAVCQHYDIDQGELEGWLFVTSGLDMPIKIAATRLGSIHIDPITAGAIIRTISDNDIGVASFDPLIAHHAAAENATGDMDQVIREFARIANATDCAIEIVHHTRKPAPGQEELSVIDSRGAGAIINAVRSARVLNPMSRAEADKANIDDVDRRLHFRVDKGKANMAPPTAARWHRFEGVELPNGDNVGVATAWLYPGQGGEQALETAKTAEFVFLQLLNRFTLEGRRVGHKPGPNYAPSVFAKEREAKVAKVGSTVLADAMRDLFATKRIRAETAKRSGRDASFIVPV